ncbi:hypothetical protein IQ22_03376 [Pseudomonas duriflava]|uniref:DUF7740 domain-containing protein n=1 Tax=Pseudomonas duriflava TaxID=459528 RepID=A0A562Q9A1_9PSED|nr:hypothetical protein [Pseudomonas duriflava]TWI52606.1 hypothetical protein IQ22_03376 [Pseudomonas duriflava]
MTFLEAILALGLAAEIHDSNEAINFTAKRCLNEIPSKYKEIIQYIAESASPLFYVRALIKTIPDSVINKLDSVSAQ